MWQEPIRAIRKIFRENLGVKPGERVLVYTDKPTRREKLTPGEAGRRADLRDVVHLFEAIGKGLCRELRFHEYPAGGAHGKEPPRKVWELAFGRAAVEAMDEAGVLKPIISKRAKPEQLETAVKIIKKRRRSAVDVIVALSNFSTSHTTFRTFLNELCGTRVASMPLFEMAMLSGPLRVDYREMSRLTRKVAVLLTKNSQVHITTSDGTDIRFSIKGRKGEPDTGMLAGEGSFGNLPAGEAYLAPVEGTANGKLVILWAPTRRLASPVTVTVRDGNAVKVTGREPYVKELDALLKKHKGNSNIAELGIGTNPLATRPDNILESEKILGTVHMAFGDNSSFGGKVKTPFHQDYVYFRPTVTLTNSKGEETLLHKDGKLLV
ncbi:MAG: aminopeptidase [Thermodesulfovibrionales bacterium]|nr:aminopeptidase [Thermodesulfovibrionales bacterium]